jgi:MFS family permease
MVAAAKKIDFRPLRDRSLRRLLGAQITSISGDFIVIAALPFAVFEIGGDSTQVSVAFGAGALLEVLLVLFGGVIGDRFRRRAVMVTADVVRFTSQCILALLLILGVAEFWQLVLVQMIQGAGAAFFNPSMNGLIPEVIPERRLQDANALMTIGPAAGTMLGPAFAGILIAAGSVGWAFALDAVTFGVSALILSRIHVPSTVMATPQASVIGELREGWVAFRKCTWLWVIVLEFSLLNALVLGPFQVLGADAARTSLGGPSSWMAILAAVGLGQLTGSMIAILWRPRRPLFIATLLIGAWAIPLVLLAASAPLPAVVFFAALAGATIAIFGAIWHTMLQTRVPENQRARMSSYDWLGSLAFLPFGYLIAAGAEMVVGANATLLASACITVVATAIVVPLPAIRGLRYRPPPRLIMTPAVSSAAPTR